MQKLARSRFPTAWLVGVCLALTAHRAAAQKSEPARIDFAQDVRPIFAGRCFACHGPEKQESGLRLDRREVAFRGGEADVGPAIVPGDSAKSALIAAVRGTHDELQKMPPEGDGLTADQIAVLTRWIDEGANWPDALAEPGSAAATHWAFQPPVRRPAPSVQREDWPRNAIDGFILARLEREGFDPSPEADRVTLLRRLSLDLIGLPPSPEDVEAFLADRGADAYERQIERLLASPHYGERWGRHWLDSARYADSDGYEKDKSRNVWHYRDWVVAALNRDLPYDRFLVEQIAGDLLEHPTQDQIVATGFLRNSMLNEEGGVDPEQFRVDAMFDRMDCIGKSILGLTIQCAQCHSHKYDPLTQEEYYRLFAFLNNDDEPTEVVYSPADQVLVSELRSAIDRAERELQSRLGDWSSRLAAWEAEVEPVQPVWTALEPSEYGDVDGGAKLSLLPDGSLLCAGYAPTTCTYRIKASVSLPKITGLRLDALTNPNLPAQGPGRSFKGTFGLTEVKVFVAPASDPTKKSELKLAPAVADFSQPEAKLEANFDDRSGRDRRVGPAAWASDGDELTAWGIDAGPGLRNRDRAIVIPLAEAASLEGPAIITVELVQNHGGWNSDDHQNNLLGCFRLSVTDVVDPASATPLRPSIAAMLGKVPDQRSAAEQSQLFTDWRERDASCAEVSRQIEELWKRWPAGSTTLALRARQHSRSTCMLTRGNFLKPGEAVEAGVPAFLHPLPEGAGRSRLAMARWLSDRASPTTARVIVNRVWQAYFGIGLVATPEDFGLQGERPTHLELLDWLACELMDSGWSLKQIHRQIVSAATYRQSSHVSEALLQRDPQNRLLSRGARHRVEAEIVRDVALAASGLLNDEVGGPPVFPPLPQSVLALSYGPMQWNTDSGPARYRRSLYTFRRRSIPFPSLQTFDAPNGDFSCVRRSRSTTPLQSLTTLNDTLFVECAQELARRSFAHGTSDPERIEYAFRRCLGRQPDPEELEELRQLLDRQRQRMAEGWTNPLLVATGRTDPAVELPPGGTPTELAALTIVTRVILNLDEAITRE